MTSDLIVDAIRYGCPVALAAIGETVSQRAGVINIGLEGLMLVSAFSGAMVALDTGNPWLGMGAGVLTGLVGALLQALFTLRFAADQVVVGTALNLFALGLTNTLFRLRFGGSGQLLSLPSWPQWGGVDPMIVVTAVLVGFAGWGLARTRWGLAVRGSGEYPPAVEASGFRVPLLRLTAVAIGGVFAGLAGAYLSVGLAGSFSENMTNGRGFVAIAMVTFGRWRPIWVLAASLLLGLAQAAQFWAQAQGFGLPSELFLALPYLLALIVLVVVGRGTDTPAALGLPYRRET